MELHALIKNCGYLFKIKESDVSATEIALYPRAIQIRITTAALTIFFINTPLS